MAAAKNKLDIYDIKNWKKTSKKSYDVYVCMPKMGTQVTNKLEGANYITDANKRFVISGTVGETWVIDVNKLAKTYCFMDGQPITPQSLQKRVQHVDGSDMIDWMHLKTLPGGGGLNYAFHLPSHSIQNFPVQTSWGDTLYANRTGIEHGGGDFLVCAAGPDGGPNLNDIWVVNGKVFPTTYDMRAFPGLATDKALLGKTPEPKSILTGRGGAKSQARINIEKIEKALHQIANINSEITDEADNDYVSLWVKGKTGLSDHEVSVVIYRGDARKAYILFGNDEGGVNAKEDVLYFNGDNHAISNKLNLIKTWVTGYNPSESFEFQKKANKANALSIKDFSEKITAMIGKATNGRLKADNDYVDETYCIINIDPAAGYKGLMAQIYPIDGTIALFDYRDGKEDDPYEDAINIRTKDGLLKAIRIIDKFIATGVITH